jgi:Eukaryotic translation initiation factor 3 subunit 8 N-terminus
VTLASQLNKDFLKKRDNEDDIEVTLTLPSLPTPTSCCPSSPVLQTLISNLLLLFQAEVVDDKTGPIKIVGSLESFIVRLEDEYTKSLQQINPHTQVRYSSVLTIIYSYQLR